MAKAKDNSAANDNRKTPLLDAQLQVLKDAGVTADVFAKMTNELAINPLLYNNLTLPYSPEIETTLGKVDRAKALSAFLQIVDGISNHLQEKIPDTETDVVKKRAEALEKIFDDAQHPARAEVEEKLILDTSGNRQDLREALHELFADVLEAGQAVEAGFSVDNFTDFLATGELKGNNKKAELPEATKNDLANKRTDLLADYGVHAGNIVSLQTVEDMLKQDMGLEREHQGLRREAGNFASLARAQEGQQAAKSDAVLNKIVNSDSNSTDDLEKKANAIKKGYEAYVAKTTTDPDEWKGLLLEGIELSTNQNVKAVFTALRAYGLSDNELKAYVESRAKLDKEGKSEHPLDESSSAATKIAGLDEKQQKALEGLVDELVGQFKTIDEKKDPGETIGNILDKGPEHEQAFALEAKIQADLRTQGKSNLIEKAAKVGIALGLVTALASAFIGNKQQDGQQPGQPGHDGEQAAQSSKWKKRLAFVGGALAVAGCVVVGLQMHKAKKNGGKFQDTHVGRLAQEAANKLKNLGGGQGAPGRA
jgi:hypothetical protein